MPLTPEEKAARKRDRMISKAHEKSIKTYANSVVAPIFQKMIRAEFAANTDGFAQAMVDYSLEFVPRDVGYCACVTCGKVTPWTNGKMQTGHFLAGRTNSISILLVEDNVAPQCVYCNYYQKGAQQVYRQWMLAVRGEETVERLEQLKRQSVSFDREELVDMRIQYQERLKAAEESMRSMI